MSAATMQPRMKNPAMLVSGAGQAIQALGAAISKADVPAGTLELIHLRVSQINGCSACVDAGSKQARGIGVSDERLASVAAWREAPYFTDAERAALALAESVTRLADRADPVPHDVWDEATAHYDEKPLGAVLLAIAQSNLFNRLNAPTKQIAGSWG